MQAILIHHNRRARDEVTQGLAHENITMSEHPNVADLNGELFDSAFVLIYADPHHHKLLEEVAQIRQRKYSLPIIILDESEHTNIKNKILQNGADAYFAKPFEYREIATEIKQIMCKKESLCVHKWLRAFDIWLDLNKRLVRRCNQIIPLSNKEFSLLEYFIINRGKIITRDSLMEYVWDRNANFASNTVDVHVNRLRKKLDDPFKEKLIHTVHCVGYVFDRKR